MPGITRNSASKSEKNVTETTTTTAEDLLEKMRQLNEKLLLLDYSKEFVADYKCPPIHRWFFCRPLNQAQQFFTFCSLCSYLLNKLNPSVDNPIKLDSFDDPNLTIDRIISTTKSYGIDCSSITRNHLKQSYGLDVINLLTLLVDRLLIEKFQNQDVNDQIKINYYSSEGTLISNDDDDDDNYELDEDDQDQENEIELEEEFEDYLETDLDYLGNNNQDEDDDDWINQSSNDQKQLIESSLIDPSEWKLELDRVLPQMNAKRFMIKNQLLISDNEWRIHLQAADFHHRNIETLFSQTETMLGTISNEMRMALDKIKAKENYLHQNCNTILAEWINVRQKALDLKQSLNESEAELEQKSLRLQELNDEDRQTKQSIEEFSLRITDSSPLAEAKKAKEMLKQELTRINLQIGVAVQIIARHVSHHSSY